MNAEGIVYKIVTLSDFGYLYLFWRYPKSKFIKFSVLNRSAFWTFWHQFLFRGRSERKAAKYLDLDSKTEHTSDHVHGKVLSVD